MQSSNIKGANQILLTHLQLKDIFSNTVHLYKKINKQENVCTSSAGKGIACPHSISLEIDELTCVLGISHEGIDYNSPDIHDSLYKSENSNEILNIISQWEENENKKDNRVQ